MSKYYYLSEGDHLWPSWVLFTPLGKITSKRRVPGAISPTVNRLLGPRSAGPIRIKPPYAKLLCPRCGRYEASEAYDIGFDEDVSIGIQGDFGHTTDRVLVITSAFLAALKMIGVRGYESQPIGKTGWHALRISLAGQC